MPKYRKFVSSYVRMERHQTVNNPGGTIFQRDWVTIGGLITLSPGKSVYYGNQNFIFTVNNVLTGQTRRGKTNWVGTYKYENVQNSKDEVNNVKPNLSSNDLRSFAYYGSAVELVRASIEDIIAWFPANMKASSRQVQKPPLNEGDPFQDLAGFIIDNPFQIDLHHKNVAIGKWDNPMRFMSASFNDYTINGKPVTKFVIGDWLGDRNCPQNSYYTTVIEITINDTVIRGIQLDATTIAYVTDDPNLVIQPKSEVIEKYFDGLEGFERQLLNRKSKPLYSNDFKTPYRMQDDSIVFTDQTYTWPSDGYCIIIDGIAYETFVTNLSQMATLLDEAYCDNLYQRMTHEAIRNFDWTYTKEWVEGEEDDNVDGGNRMMEILHVVARFFDDIKADIEGIGNMSKVTLDGYTNAPDAMLSEKAGDSGWDAYSTIPSFDYPAGVDPTLIKIDDQFVNDFITKQAGTALPAWYSATPTDSYTTTAVDINFSRLLILFAKRIFQSKGTRESIDMVFGLFGIGENDYTITEDYYTTVPKKYQDVIDEYSEINRNKVDLPYMENIDFHPLTGIPMKDILIGNDTYIVPFYDQNKIYDGNLYFQQKGGWGNYDSSVAGYGFLETVNYMHIASNITDLLGVNETTLRENDYYYVNDISDYSQYTDNIPENATNYFKLENYSAPGNFSSWKNVSMKDTDARFNQADYNNVKYLDGIVSSNIGNNPHVGYGSYDRGEDFLDYMRKPFKYALDNYYLETGYDTRADAVVFPLNKQLDSDKVKIELVDDPTKYYINSKVITITNNIDNDYYRQYLMQVVLQYVMQVIPSTAILVLENFVNSGYLFSASPMDIVFEAAGGTFTVTVKSSNNGKTVGYTIDGAAAAWATATKNADGSITITANENAGFNENTGSITLTQDESGKKVTINLHQNAKSNEYVLTGTPLKSTVSPEENDFDVAITSTKNGAAIGYTVGTVPDWLTATVTAAGIHFHLKANDGATSREQQVTITQNESGKQVVVDIMQAVYQYTFTANTADKVVGYDGATIPLSSFNVVSNRAQYVNGTMLPGTQEAIGYKSTVAGVGSSINGNDLVIDKNDGNNKTFVLSFIQDETNKTITVNIQQGTQIKAYSDIIIDKATAIDIPAGGGSVGACDVLEYHQTWGYNDEVTSGGTITTGATVMYSGAVTAVSLKDTLKGRTKVGELTVTVKLNGKTASKVIDIYQEENKLVIGKITGGVAEAVWGNTMDADTGKPDTNQYNEDDVPAYGGYGWIHMTEEPKQAITYTSGYSKNAVVTPGEPTFIKGDNLGTVVTPRKAIGQSSITYTGEQGESKTFTVDIYQQANEEQSSNGQWTIDIQCDTTVFPNTGGNDTIKATATRTVNITYTSGATGEKEETDTPKLSIAGDPAFTLTGNKIQVTENQTLNQRTSTVTATMGGVTQTFGFAQEAGVMTYSEIVVIATKATDDIPASGGSSTLSSGDIQYKQTWGWNGKTVGGGEITTGGIVSIGSPVTAESLGTTVTPRRVVGQLVVTVSLNGKIGVGNIDVYQEANIATVLGISLYWDYDGTGTRYDQLDLKVPASGTAAPMHILVIEEIEYTSEEGEEKKIQNFRDLTTSENWVHNSGTGTITVDTRGTVEGPQRTASITATEGTFISNKLNIIQAENVGTFGEVTGGTAQLVWSDSNNNPNVYATGDVPASGGYGWLRELTVPEQNMSFTSGENLTQKVTVERTYVKGEDLKDTVTVRRMIGTATITFVGQGGKSQSISEDVYQAANQVTYGEIEGIYVIEAWTKTAGNYTSGLTAGDVPNTGGYGVAYNPTQPTQTVTFTSGFTRNGNIIKSNPNAIRGYNLGTTAKPRTYLGLSILTFTGEGGKSKDASAQIYQEPNP